MSILNEEIFTRFGKVTDIIETNTNEINSLGELLNKHNENEFTLKSYISNKFFLDEFILIIDRDDENGAYVHIVNNDNSDTVTMRVFYNSFVTHRFKGFEKIVFDKNKMTINITPNADVSNAILSSGLYTEVELKTRIEKSSEMFARTVLLINTLAILNIDAEAEKKSGVFKTSTNYIKKNNKKKSKGGATKNKVSIFRKHSINSSAINNFNYNIRTFKYKASSWGVKGHPRTLKNGETIWIKPGVRHRRKELLNSSSCEHKNKTYTLS